MKIGGYDLMMAGSHAESTKQEKKESIKAWTGKQPAPADEKSVAPAVTINLGAQALAMAGSSQKATTSTRSVDDENDPRLTSRELLEIRLIQAAFEAITGQKIKFSEIRVVRQDASAIDVQALKQVEYTRQSETTSTQDTTKGWGLEYDYYERYEERESLSFSAKGIITTTDGKEVAVDVDVSMTRQFISENRISVRAGDAVRKDPIVVNFDGRAAELDTNKFSFDIDSSGSPDLLSFLKPGSGFLALDRNGDGRINDGKELFGPSTGNGFEELKKLDEDSNNWIDENDSIYDKLRIWAANADGSKSLFALGQKGVGAIYLGAIETPFTLKDQENNELGVVRRSSIYLSEGSAGTVQQVDLTA